MAGKSGGAWVPGPLGTSAPLWDSGCTVSPGLCSTDEGAGRQGGRELQEAWPEVLGGSGRAESPQHPQKHPQTLEVQRALAGSWQLLWSPES